MSNRRKLRKPPPTTFVSRPPTVPPTYWNGQPTPAVRVRVIVADAPDVPQYWARELVGTAREAVRVTYGGEIFYLDNEDGSGWLVEGDARRRVAALGAPQPVERARSHRENVKTTQFRLRVKIVSGSS